MWLRRSCLDASKSKGEHIGNGRKGKSPEKRAQKEGEHVGTKPGEDPGGFRSRAAEV